MVTLRIGSCPDRPALPNVLLFLSLLLFFSQWGGVVQAAQEQSDTLPPIDVVFCLVADGYPAIYPTSIIVALARRVVAKNPGHTVRFGIVAHRHLDSDLQLDLTADQDQFLAVLNRWHNGYQTDARPVGVQLKVAMEHLTWNDDPNALRKLYIVASGGGCVENSSNKRVLVGYKPGIGLNLSLCDIALTSIFETLKETGSTIPVAPGIDISVTEYTSFVTEFANSLSGKRASVSMVYLGDPMLPMGFAVDSGNDTETVCGWFDIGWPFREGWVEDAKRGGGEFVQYIFPNEGSAVAQTANCAILFSNPEEFHAACRYFFSVMDVRRAVDKARLQILMDKAEKAGFTGFFRPDSSGPVIRFFLENPQLHGIVIH